MTNPNQGLLKLKAISHYESSRIITFLSQATTPEEIVEVMGISNNRDAAMRAARKVLDKRAKNGEFTSLEEVRALLDAVPIDGLVDSLYQGRPTVSVNGQWHSQLSDRLLELSVEESRTHGPRCEATFGNWGPAGRGMGYLWLDRNILDLGKTIDIQLGQSVLPAQVFQGCITGIRATYPKGGSPQVTVLAENRHEVQLRMARRTRTFESINDKGVVQQIASEHGLQLDMDTDGAMHRILVQANQSDIEFILQRAHAIGATVRVDGDVLRVRALPPQRQSSIALTYGRQLNQFSVTADLTDQRTSVRVTAWNQWSKETDSHEANESIIQAELAGGQSGSSLLGQTLAPVTEEVRAATEAGDELRLLAEARYKEVARRFICGSGVASGFRNLRAGDEVNLQGLEAMFNGRYCVNHVKYFFTTAEGFRTCFDVVRPWLGSA